MTRPRPTVGQWIVTIIFVIVMVGSLLVLTVSFGEALR